MSSRIEAQWILLLARVVLATVMIHYGWPKVRDLKSNGNDFVNMGISTLGPCRGSIGGRVAPCHFEQAPVQEVGTGGHARLIGTPAAGNFAAAWTWSAGHAVGCPAD
jgi:hypothetical protein